MWRPNEPVEEDASNLPGIDPHSKRRRSGRRAWRDGLARPNPERRAWTPTTCALSIRVRDFAMAIGPE
jgi:hypothetical protein